MNSNDNLWNSRHTNNISTDRSQVTVLCPCFEVRASYSNVDSSVGNKVFLASYLKCSVNEWEAVWL